VKFAVELGFAIMLNKPIIAVLQPGGTLPDKLRLVADEIVYMPAKRNSAAFTDDVLAALTRIRNARQPPASS
jgi:nucleoside 2-deoxyribosyltransferase